MEGALVGDDYPLWFDRTEVGCRRAILCTVVKVGIVRKLTIIIRLIRDQRLGFSGILCIFNVYQGTLGFIESL